MSLAIKTLRVSFDTLMWVDSATDRPKCLREAKSRALDTILDSIFGPAEDTEYVSTTAPSSPPPT